MIKHDININKLLLSWLTITIILVFFTIIIGGLTRLTNSGLSITEWELFKGILPPMTQTAWNNYFDLYKKIPQFQLLNNTMDLAEFKIRKKLDLLDNSFLELIKKRTKLVNQVLLTKKFKKDIVDKKRIRIILKNIQVKSKLKKIDPKITNKIWKSMISAYIDYEYKNFKKK